VPFQFTKWLQDAFNAPLVIQVRWRGGGELGGWGRVRAGGGWARVCGRKFALETAS
jgi:hypothetical protein